MRKLRLKESLCSLLSNWSGLSPHTNVPKSHKEKCLVSQSSSTGHPWASAAHALLALPFLPSFRFNTALTLWLGLAFPRHLLTSSKGWRIWLLCLNPLPCPPSFVLFCFVGFFSTSGFKLVLSASGELGWTSVHPAPTPEPGVGLLVQALDSLSLSGSCKHRVALRVRPPWILHPTPLSCVSLALWK